MRTRAFIYGIPAAALLSVMAFGQSVPPAPTPLTDIYGAGAAYSTGATPGSVPVAVNAFEAHLIPAKDNTRTYSYTTLFLVPTKQTSTVTNADGTTTTTSLTVFSKDIGVGAAVKVLDIGPHGIYATATGGPSWTGTDTSWQFNYGATVPIRIKKTNYYLFPMVTGVSGGSAVGGTKVMFLLDFAWGR